jgi:hypothetical protein
MHVKSRQYHRKKVNINFQVMFFDSKKNTRELVKIRKNCDFSANGVMVEYDTNTVRPEVGDDVLFDFDMRNVNYMIQSTVVRKNLYGFALYFKSTNWDVQNLFKTF